MQDMMIFNAYAMVALLPEGCKISAMWTFFPIYLKWIENIFSVLASIGIWLVHNEIVPVLAYD